MKRHGWSILFLLASIGSTANGQGLSWEAGASDEHLTRGLAPWRSVYLRGQWRLPANRLIYGGWRAAERYGRTDEEMHLGSFLPLAEQVHLQVEFGHSPTHHILAANYLDLRLETRLAEGLTGAAGWRHASYTDSRTDVGQLGIERYFGSQRIGYTLFEGRPAGADFVASHRLHWAWHYDRADERSWMGIAAVSGRETEYAGAAGFLTGRVTGLQVSGLHLFDRHWAISWEAGQTRQGDFYTRQGWRLGLRHDF